ncbi:MAG: nitroreductase family protein [Nocardioidaceae bacterium]
MTLPLLPDALLTTTRAVRKRLDLTRPVPLDLVRKCLEIALQGPSGSNAQSWHWVVVTDAGQRAAVGEIYRQEVEKYAASRHFAGRLHADEPDRAAVQQRVGDSAVWLGDHMGQVPVLLVPCIATGRPLPAGNQAGLWGSLLPAVWNYMLAARARGLGTSWTSLHLAREREVAEILGIPEGVHQGALVPTAFYTGDTFKPAPREPLDTVLHLDRW